MPSPDWSGVPDRIAALRDHPAREGVFGYPGHRFQLAPPLSLAELVELEDFLGVTLPADYRSYLTEVGAGGAGPFYGVLPVRRTAEGWEWAGESGRLTDLTRLTEPFPTDRVDPAVLEALEAERPAEDDYDDLDDLDAALDRWDERLEAILERPEATQGAICLADEGCAYRDWLVVSGPAAGSMWEDPRCVDRDLTPMPGGPVTFGAWYLAWLDECERVVTTAADGPPPDRLSRTPATRPGREAPAPVDGSDDSASVRVR